MPAYTKPRQAFFNAICDVSDWEEGQPEPQVEVNGRALTVSGLCGHLWRCTDLMPNQEINFLGNLAEDMDLTPCGPTFAAGARQLKRIIATIVSERAREPGEGGRPGSVTDARPLRRVLRSGDGRPVTDGCV